MKKFILFCTVSLCSMLTVQSFAQPTSSLSMRPKDAQPIASPKDSIAATLNSGATVTITYGSPGLWGRTIGKDVDPMDDSVWRAGANEATTFAVDKNVMIEGKSLPAGRYALFAKKHGKEWTLIFNKEWNTWGAYSYKQNMGSDALQVKVPGLDGKFYNERLKYVIDPNGSVYLMWGTHALKFDVK